MKSFLSKTYLRINGLGGFVEDIPDPGAQRFCGSLSLTAGRGQYVSFQIALEPSGGTLDSLELLPSP